MTETPQHSGAPSFNSAQALHERAANLFYRLATFAVIVAILHYAAPVLLPFAMSILLALIFIPLLRKLEHLRLRRPMALVIIVAIGASAVCSLGWIAERELSEFIVQWPECRVALREKCHNLAAWYDHYQEYRAEI